MRTFTIITYIGSSEGVIHVYDGRTLERAMLKDAEFLGIDDRRTAAAALQVSDRVEIGGHVLRRHEVEVG